MATWKLSPQYKKSAIEKMFFYKDGKTISVEQGFRWATFTPLTDEELKNEDGYELGCIENDECWEMWDMIDGCWCEIQAENNATPEDVEEFEAAWEEDSYSGVEELGWSNDDTEYYYHGPLELTNEDTGQVFKGEPDEEDLPAVGVPEMKFEEKLEVLRELEEEKSALTEWYPADINPVRNGTYQVLETETEVKWPFPSNVTSAVWNGATWDKPVAKWRGLNEDPNEV
jgi:hypothetical protein